MLQEVDQTYLEWMLENRPETPEGKSGKISITHEVIPIGTELPIVSMRNAIFMGQKPTKIKFTHPFIIRHLKEEDQGEWMTDSPQEIWQMAKPIQECHGKVLVGGLGLGVVAHLMDEINDDIKEVVVIEKNSDILDLVSDAISDGVDIREGNLFEYLKHVEPEQYDSAFFDIWQSTGEISWVEYIVPLRRATAKKIPHVLCWNEVEMQGQLRNTFQSAAYCKEDDLYQGMMAYADVFRRCVQKDKVVVGEWGEISQPPMKECFAN